MVVVAFSNPVPREVGHLAISVEDWDFLDPERLSKISYPLETHICTDQELGLAESGGTMPHLFPLVKNEYDILNGSEEKLCINEQDLRLYGSYNGNRSRRIKVSVQVCHGHDYCLAR